MIEKTCLFLFLFGFFAFPRFCQAKVYINEISPQEEWVELYSETENVSLDGYVLYFHDDKESSQQAPLSGQMVGKYQVVDTGGLWLNNGGDTVILEKDGEDQDTVVYGGEAVLPAPGDGKFLARVPDGGDWSIVGTPSKNSTNGEPIIEPEDEEEEEGEDEDEPEPELEDEAEEEETSSSDIYINAAFPNSVTAGEKFSTSFNISGAESGQEYYAKVVIEKEGTSFGETIADNSDLLSNTTDWTKFPKIAIDDSGNCFDQVEAQVKSGSDAGDYRLMVRIRPVSDGDFINSEDYPISVLAGSEAALTSEPTPTNTPTTTLTPTPTSTNLPTPSIASPSATLSPEIVQATEEEGSFDLTESKGEVLGQKMDTDDQLVSDKVGSSSSKFIAGGLVVLGGGLVGSVFVLPKFRSKSDKIKKNEKKEPKIEDKQKIH